MPPLFCHHHQGFYSSNGQSDQQSRLRPKKWGIDYKGNLAQIQSNWIPNTKNFQAQPVPGDCFTTIPGCQRCELKSTGPVCWQCLFNYKQTSFVLSQTLGFPTGFCGEQQLWVSPAAAGWSCGMRVCLGRVTVS
jgi:hypothetical protein